MKNITRNFSYIEVGGRCAYDDNVIKRYPGDDVTYNSMLYTIVNDVLVAVVDSNSHISFVIGNNIIALDYYLLDIICYIGTDVINPQLSVKWNTSVNYGPEYVREAHVSCSDAVGKFVRILVDLREYTGWRGNISELSVYLSNKPCFMYLHSIRLYSEKYRCTNTGCYFFSNYSNPCIGSYKSECLVSRGSDDNITILNNVLEITINNVLYRYMLNNTKYTLTALIDEIDEYFRSLPVGKINIRRLGVNTKICHTCDSVVIGDNYVWVALGFLDDDFNEVYTITTTDYIESKYVDVAGNLVGTYKYVDTFTLDLENQPCIGNKVTSSLIPASYVDFYGSTVIFKACLSSHSGVFNNITLDCITTVNSEIYIYRRNGNAYVRIDTIPIHTINSGVFSINFNKYINKGDIIGLYDVSIKSPKKVDTALNYYHKGSGKLSSFSVDDFDLLVYAAVPIHITLDIPNIDTVSLKLLSNRVGYIDGVYNTPVNNNKYDIDITTLFDINDINRLIFCSTDYSKQPDISVSNNEIGYSFVGSCDSVPSVDTTITFELPIPVAIQSVSVNIYGDINPEYLTDVSTYSGDSCNSLVFTNRFNIVTIGSSDLSSNSKEDDIDVIGATGDMDYNGTEHKCLGIRYVYSAEVPVVDYYINIWLKTSIYTLFPEIPINLFNVSFSDSIYIDITNTYSPAGYYDSSLLFNVRVLYGRFISLEGLKVVSSRVPDSFYTEQNDVKLLTMYNTRQEKLHCYIDSMSNYGSSIEIFNYSNNIGSSLVRVIHDPFYFMANNFDYEFFINYELDKLLYKRSMFSTLTYDFSSESYDWFVPYDYEIASYDGVFLFNNGNIKVLPKFDTAVRWFNYINSYIFDGDIDVDIDFTFVGNRTGYALIGVTLFDNSFNNFVRVYVAYKHGEGYGVEYKLNNDDEPHILTVEKKIGTRQLLRVSRVGDTYYFYDVSSSNAVLLNSGTIFTGCCYVAVSVTFYGDSFKDNTLCYINKISISYFTMVSGKRCWYTVDDAKSVVYMGNIVDNVLPLSNVGQYLALPSNNTIKKVVYKFVSLQAKYIKLSSTTLTDITITNIDVYNKGCVVTCSHGYVSYNNDVVYGSLESEADTLIDGCIVNIDKAVTITNDSSMSKLSSVGVSLDSMQEIDTVVVYYRHAGIVAAPRITYSYNNNIYADVFSNYKLFSTNTTTTTHLIFNEYAGHRSGSIVKHSYASESDFDTYFDSECPASYKWDLPPSYTCNSGIMLDSSSITSKFYVDGDFSISVFFDDITGISQGGSFVGLYVYFSNCTTYTHSYVQHKDNHIVWLSESTSKGVSVGTLRDYEGGLRIDREGSIIKWLYREGMTTWKQVDNKDYGNDYVYPVYIKIVTGGGCSARILNVIVDKGLGIGDGDAALIESYFDNSMFVRGAYVYKEHTSYVNVVDDYDKFVQGNTSIGILVEHLAYMSGDNLFIDKLLCYNMYISNNEDIVAVVCGDYDININIGKTISYIPFSPLYWSFLNKPSNGVAIYFSGDNLVYDGIYGTEDTTQIKCNEKLSDDFDINMWFNVSDNSVVDNLYIRLEVRDVSNHSVAIGKNNYSGGRQWVVYENEVSETTGNKDLSYGWFRVTKEGYTFKFYYKETSSDPWVLADTRTFTQFVGDLYKVIMVSRGYNYPDVKVYFDDFLPNNDNIYSLVTVSFGADNINNSLFKEVVDANMIAYSSSEYSDVLLDEKFNGNFSSGLTVNGYFYYIDNKVMCKRSCATIKTDGSIIGSHGLSVEVSILFKSLYSSSDVSVLTICDHDMYGSTYKSIYIRKQSNSRSLRVYANHSYMFSLDINIRINCWYLIGVRILGNKATIYWRGDISGCATVDVSNITGSVYVWTGLYSGGYLNNSNDGYHCVRRLIVRRDVLLFSSINDEWFNSVSLSDTFGGSSGRLPDANRWYVEGNPRTHSGSLIMRSSYLDLIKAVYKLSYMFSIRIDFTDFTYALSQYSGFYIKIYKYRTELSDYLVMIDTIFLGYVSDSGIETQIDGDTQFYSLSSITDGYILITNDGNYFTVQYSDGVSTVDIRQEPFSCYLIEFELSAVGDGVSISINDVTVSGSYVLSPYGPTTKIPMESYDDIRGELRSYRSFTVLPLYNVLDSYTTYNIDFIIFNNQTIPWCILLLGDVSSVTPISSEAELKDKISIGGIVYVGSGIYNLSGVTLGNNTCIVGVGNYNDIVLHFDSSAYIDQITLYFYNIKIVYNALEGDSYCFYINGSSVTFDNCYLHTEHTAGMFETYNYVSHIYLIGTETSNLWYGIKDNCVSYLYLIGSVFKPYYGISKYGKCIVSSRWYSTSSSSVYGPTIKTDGVVMWLYNNIATHNTLCSCFDDTFDMMLDKEQYYYISVGNGLGGMYFYSGGKEFHFFDCTISSDTLVLEYCGVVDTLRVDNNYISTSQARINIKDVNNNCVMVKTSVGGDIKLHKIYRSYNNTIFNTSLHISEYTHMLVDEYIFDNVVWDDDYILELNDRVNKADNVSSYTMNVEDCVYRFFVDMGDVVGISKIIYDTQHTFDTVKYFKDNKDVPLNLTQESTADECRWYVIESNIEQNSNNRSPGSMSMFPDINKDGVFYYTGVNGIVDNVINAVIVSTPECITDTYNIIRHPVFTFTDYAIFDVENGCEIQCRYADDITITSITVKSGVLISNVYEGYIKRVSIKIGGYTDEVDDVINSTITFKIPSIKASMVIINIKDVYDISGLNIDGNYISGSFCCVEYISILGGTVNTSFLDNIAYSVDTDKLMNVAGVTISNNCSSAKYKYKCVSTSDSSVNFSDFTPTSYNGCLQSILIERDTYTDCNYTYKGVSIVVPFREICSTEEMWYVVKGDIDLDYSRYYTYKGSTGSICMCFYKQTLFEICTYKMTSNTFYNVGITDKVVVVIYSEVYSGDLYIKVGTLSTYYKWPVNVTPGYNTIRLGFDDTSIVKIKNNNTYPDLLFSDIPLERVCIGGEVLINSIHNIYLINVSIEPNSNNNIVSSRADGIEVPVCVFADNITVNMSFISMWDSFSGVYNSYKINKTLLGIIGDVISLSVTHRAHGGFRLNVVVTSTKYRRTISGNIPQHIRVGDSCELSVYLKKDNSDILIVVVFNGYTLFNTKAPCSLTEILSVATVVVGGAYVYTHPVDTGVSLCGEFKDVSVIVSNGTEAIIELNNVMVKVSGDFEPLVDLLPLYLGEVNPGDKVELPIKVESFNTGISLYTLWVLDR